MDDSCGLLDSVQAAFDRGNAEVKEFGIDLKSEEEIVFTVEQQVQLLHSQLAIAETRAALDDMEVIREPPRPPAACFRSEKSETLTSLWHPSRPPRFHLSTQHETCH